MNGLQKDVTEFHQAFGHPAPVFPVERLTEGVADLLRKRAKWLHEEADELIEACDEGDIVKAIDALGDSIYFGVGGYVVLGLDLAPYWVNIQRSNMEKLGPDGKPILNDEDGKVMKPEGWVAPEPRHREQLDRDIRMMAIEGMARQLAYLRVTAPEDPVVLPPTPVSPIELEAVMRRADRIVQSGSTYAIALHGQMVDEIGEL